MRHYIFREGYSGYSWMTFPVTQVPCFWQVSKPANSTWRMKRGSEPNLLLKESLSSSFFRALEAAKANYLRSEIATGIICRRSSFWQQLSGEGDPQTELFRDPNAVEGTPPLSLSQLTCALSSASPFKGHEANFVGNHWQSLEMCFCKRSWVIDFIDMIRQLILSNLLDTVENCPCRFAQISLLQMASVLQYLHLESQRLRKMNWGEKRSTSSFKKNPSHDFPPKSSQILPRISCTRLFSLIKPLVTLPACKYRLQGGPHLLHLRCRFFLCFLSTFFLKAKFKGLVVLQLSNPTLYQRSMVSAVSWGIRTARNIGRFSADASSSTTMTTNWSEI